eukprot:CAMPEP_0173187988 /NCGR_PEP_ID=MMETSP1141-20130122/11018_2 /TAXON_ID=483371 /ORGANISM="non described non described, Strain CCMP2298" /LENGTH=203 /DNA_ID=CAMNT_0014111893 /DNA_START=89 /DNA_END=697 /DNA_ORIENTATION=-
MHVALLLLLLSYGLAWPSRGVWHARGAVGLGLGSPTSPRMATGAGAGRGVGTGTDRATGAGRGIGVRAGGSMALGAGAEGESNTLFVIPNSPASMESVVLFIQTWAREQADTGPAITAEDRDDGAEFSFSPCPGMRLSITAQQSSSGSSSSGSSSSGSSSINPASTSTPTSGSGGVKARRPDFLIQSTLLIPTAPPPNVAMLL